MEVGLFCHMWLRIKQAWVVKEKVQIWDQVIEDILAL